MYAISVTGVAGKRPERAFFSVFWREAEYGVKRVRRLVFKALECLGRSEFRRLESMEKRGEFPPAVSQIAALLGNHWETDVLQNCFLFMFPKSVKKASPA